MSIDMILSYSPLLLKPVNEPLLLSSGHVVELGEVDAVGQPLHVLLGLRQVHHTGRGRLIISLLDVEVDGSC